jgi:NADPH-dependent 2,4-dienoyl-CoA reductase/sulfur reductase-like enzyme
MRKGDGLTDNARRESLVREIPALAPLDAHNERLLENVHPPAWVNPEPVGRCNPGLAEAGYLTNETIFTLTERPERLAVIGAGPIGCELAQAFALLGSHVVLFENGRGVLPREDPEAEILKRAGDT